MNDIVFRYRKMKKINRIYRETKTEIPDDLTPIGYLKPNSKMPSNSRYLRVFQCSFLDIARDKDFTGDTLRIFLGILAYVEYEGIFEMSLTALAKELGMQRQNVGKAVKLLVKKGYLKKESQQGLASRYYLDPSFAFKNRVKHFEELRDTWEAMPDEKAM